MQPTHGLIITTICNQKLILDCCGQKTNTFAKIIAGMWELLDKKKPVRVPQADT